MIKLRSLWNIPARGDADEADRAFHSPAYDGIRVDGFNAAVVGPEVDIFAIEEEWVAPS